MPIIRNVTQRDQVICGKVVQPYKTIEITSSELLNLHSMINHDMIKVENFDLSFEQNEIVTEQLNNTPDLANDQEIKNNMIESFFALYLDKKLSLDHIRTLKWFYQNVGPTSIISKETKDLLNSVNNEEELIEVLLNHVYPELIKSYVENK